MPCELERCPIGTQDLVHFELGIVTLSLYVSKREVELEMELVHE